MSEHGLDPDVDHYSQDYDDDDVKTSSSGSSKMPRSKRGSLTDAFENDESRKSANDVEKLQEKIELLKHFLIVERKQRVADKLKVTQFMKSFENLKQTHSEKQSVLRKLELENSSLKEKLNDCEKQIALSAKSEDDQNGFLSSLFRSTTISTPESSPMKKMTQMTRPQLESRFITMKKELDFYQDKLNSLEEKHTCSEKVNSDLKNLYKATNEKLIFTGHLLDERDEKIRVFDDENKKLTRKISDLTEEMRNDTIGSRVWEQRNQEAIIKIEDLKKNLEQREKEIGELKIKCEKKDELADSMAKKLLNMKYQMDSINLTMKKYSVKKLNKLVGKSDVELILQKNPSSGEFILDVVYNGKHDHYLLSTITNVRLDKTNPMLFHVEMTKGSMSFESEEPEDCIKGINDFIRIQLQDSPWWDKK